MSENSIMTIADFNIETITTETKSALDVHSNIIAAEQSAANAMLSLCENLKKMRDTGLFKSLGFDKFEDYTERACNIKKRQAYNYIQTYERLGKSVMQSNAQLGITKLQLLTEVCAVERDDFIEKNDLDGMSVSEIKKLVEDNRHQGEQLSFLSDKVAKAENDSSEKDKCISELKAEIEELRKQPVEVAVQEPDENDIQKAVAERTKSIEAEFVKQKQQFQSELKEKVKSAKAAAMKKAEKDKLKAIEDAKAETKAEIEEKYKAKIETAAQKEAEALKEAEKLASKLDKNADADLVTASIYFTEAQKQLSEFKRHANKIEVSDSNRASRLKKLAIEYLTDFINSLN